MNQIEAANQNIASLESRVRVQGEKLFAMRSGMQGVTASGIKANRDLLKDLEFQLERAKIEKTRALVRNAHTRAV